MLQLTKMEEFRNQLSKIASLHLYTYSLLSLSESFASELPFASDT